MRALVALLCGGLFGAGLFVSGMTEVKKVLGFLDVFGAWDPTLAFVMAGALLPMALAWHFAASRTPLLAPAFPPRSAAGVTPSLALGAILFGIGWGFVGLCPGPAVASLSYGGIEGVTFFIAMLVGMFAAPPVRRRLDSAGAIG